MADNKNNPAKILAKLEARDRLRVMAEAAREPHDSEAERELVVLRSYLLAWKTHQEAYRPRFGFPSSSTFAHHEGPGRTASEYLEVSDRWAMDLIEHSMEDLAKKPDGLAMVCALRVRLLNEAVKAKVFRHGRLAELEPGEIDGLADAGERELVVIVKLRGLIL